MKNILLTTSALVAFAGAAAADGHTSLSFAGEASVEYLSGAATFTRAAEMTATGSATLDNGVTATASITVDGTDGVSRGSLTVSNDTTNVTFGNELSGALVASVGDSFEDDIVHDSDEGVLEGMTATVAVGTATVFVSAPGLADLNVDDMEFGVTAAVGDMTISAATANSEFAVVAGVTASGATLGFGLASGNHWDASISYPVGDLTISASTDEASAWTVGGSFVVSDALTAAIEYNSDETYEITAGYAAGDVALNSAFDGTNVELSAATTIGAIYAEAGLSYASDAYVEASYDLGGGASAYARYAQAADQNIAEDNVVGTTVGLNFSF